MSVTEHGKILAIDFGQKNVGLAVCDEGRSFVFGRGLIRNYKSLDALFEKILAMCQEEKVTMVVFGVPKGVEGEETAQTEHMRDIGGRLEEYLGTIPVVFQDEAYSSFEADVVAADFGRVTSREAGETLRKKYSSHELAAMIILERFLEREDW